MTTRFGAGSTRASAGLVLATALPAAVLAATTGPTLQAARAPGADPSALLAGLALLLGWVVVARLALLVVVVLGCRAPGAVGAVAARWVDRLTPTVLLSAVRLAAGLTVVVVPMAGTCSALAEPPDPAAVAAAEALPTLDRLIAPAAPRGPAPASPGLTASLSVLVRPGDSLWSIAAGHLPPGRSVADVARAWPRWYAANRAAIGDDPGRIRPGLVLRVPVR